jgi:MFS family permease
MQTSSGYEERERYRELLEEVRTILPGVQVLFAFLLTAPFSQRFNEIDEYGRDLYSIALVGSAVAMVLFLTPAAYHRIAPRDERNKRLTIAVRLMVVGMLVLALSVLTAVVAVMRFIFGSGVAPPSVCHWAPWWSYCGTCCRGGSGPPFGHRLRIDSPLVGADGSQ